MYMFMLGLFIGPAVVLKRCLWRFSKSVVKFKKKKKKKKKNSSEKDFSRHLFSLQNYDLAIFILKIYAGLGSH